MPEFVNPKNILKQIGLRADMTAADFGSGSGGWAIPLAMLLKDGIVLAVDVQEGPLSALESKARLEGVSNIKKITGNVETKVLEIRESSCDIVLITDLLFQVDEKEEVFKEARRVLKPEGKVLVVEWSLDSLLGPKAGRVSEEEIKSISQRLGFKLEKEFTAGDYHFALLFKK